MTGSPLMKQRTAVELSPLKQRQRTVDGRGVADIRLLQVADGPGRAQRLLSLRNASGIGLEIALDRGLIFAVPTSAVSTLDRTVRTYCHGHLTLSTEDRLGFYRNLDGLLVTCGLNHIGAVQRSEPHILFTSLAPMVQPVGRSD